MQAKSMLFGTQPGMNILEYIFTEYEYTSSNEYEYKYEYTRLATLSDTCTGPVGW